MRISMPKLVVGSTISISGCQVRLRLFSFRRNFGSSRSLCCDSLLDSIILLLRYYTHTQSTTNAFTGGQDEDGEIHPRCLYSDIKCKPIAVIDFDLFYKVNAIAEFYELRNALEASLEGTNAEMIQASVTQCAFDKVYTTPELHQGNRTQTILPPEYKFTKEQLGYMLGNTTDLRDKYAAAPYDTDPIAINLVHALGEYILQITPEYNDTE